MRRFSERICVVVLRQQGKPDLFVNPIAAHQASYLPKEGIDQQRDAQPQKGPSLSVRKVSDRPRFGGIGVHDAHDEW